MSQSQLKQDIKVLEYFNNKKQGYFLEVGASDGIELSNTYLLEKSYDWTGICIEPIPKVYEKLKLNRSCLTENKAIYNQSNIDVEFSIANCHTLLSGIPTHLDQHKEKVNNDKEDIIVSTLTLEDLLIKHNSPKFIEYMSLDTEGSEYEILKVFDFNKYKFGLIDIEHNYVEPRRSMIRNLLLENGYTYIGENHWDDCYKLYDTSEIFDKMKEENSK
tara:strand:+ start:1795 stop:2445 length:651 start_codon:yes stop_codon:yes gene_type:complete